MAIIVIQTSQSQDAATPYTPSNKKQHGDGSRHAYVTTLVRPKEPTHNAVAFLTRHPVSAPPTRPETFFPGQGKNVWDSSAALGTSTQAPFDGIDDASVPCSTANNVCQRSKPPIASAGSGSDAPGVSKEASVGMTRRGEGERGSAKRPVWQIAVTLLARSRRSGYAK